MLVNDSFMRRIYFHISHISNNLNIFLFYHFLCPINPVLEIFYTNLWVAEAVIIGMIAMHRTESALNWRPDVEMLMMSFRSISIAIC